ncbi:MAG: hypothetical protein KatS3mg095_0163 [Candidatus Parcubacteria bacterium]|nr:MAG: hypothetical protein KatS3mg095_0163 [Candidatus Parcubacteria bacterium]
MSNFNTILANKYETIYFYSLNFQSILDQLKNKFIEFLSPTESNYYKEKYYNLLKNLAQFKLAEKEEIFSKSLELFKKRFPQAEETKILSENFGIIFAQPLNNIKKDAFVIDKNWLLVGKVVEINDKYIKIISLNYANFQFNVSNLDGEYLGLAKSSGLGYLIIDKIDSKINLNKGDLVTTYGNDDIFPSGFLVGEVVDIETKGYFKTAKVIPLADFKTEKLIIVQ